MAQRSFSSSSQKEKKGSEFGCLDSVDLKTIGTRMASSLEIRDREYHFRKYSSCFLGKDAVQWLQENVNGVESKEDAIRLGNRMIAEGLFSHVLHEHLLEDRKLFYRFNCAGAEGDEDTALSDAIPTTLRKGEVQFVAIRGMQRKINQIEETLVDKNDDLFAFLRSIVAEIEENREKIDISQKILMQLRLHLLGALVLLAALLTLNFTVITGSLLTVVAVSLLTTAFVYYNGELVESLFVLKPDSKGRNEDTSSESSEKFLAKSNFSNSRFQMEQKSEDSNGRERAMSILPHDMQWLPLDLPAPAAWANKPLMIGFHPLAPDQKRLDGDRGKYLLPFNAETCFSFETDLFKGECIIRLRGVGEDSPAEKYFDGRKRQFDCIVRGVFKSELYVNDVYTGHEFQRPFKHLPGRWLVRLGTNIIRQVARGIRTDLLGSEPYLLAPLMAASQVVRVEDAKEEAPKLTDEVIEDTALLTETHLGPRPLSESKRKAAFSHRKTVSDITFSPDHRYTFDIYQHVFVPSTYTFDLGITKVDLAKSLSGQPLQIMAKHIPTGKYLWNFQIWHEKLFVHHSD